MPHFTKRYRLVVLVGLVSVLALVLVGRWLNATKRGGQGPAEPFRIAGNLYYVGATHAAAFLITAEPVTIPGHPGVAPIHQDDNLKHHSDNWFKCMRSRAKPNGSIETGFAHAVAVVMATRSYREGKKLYRDRKNEEIVDSL